MTEKLRELRAKIEENLAKLRAMLDASDQEKRDLTDDETAAYEALELETDKMEREHERLEKLAIREARAEERGDRPYLPDFHARKAAEPKEFANMGEFLHSVRFRKDDPRLNYQEFEKRGQTMGSGVEGGFAIPEQFRPQILQVTPQEAIFRPRSTVIPAGDPPDAKISMPALNQTIDQNIYGGIVVAPVAEGGTKPETDLELKQVSLEPAEVAGWVKVTDKLLRNWGAASAFLGNQLRRAVIGWEDTQFLRGNGVAKPLGIINAPAAIKVNRGTASSIITADIENMFARSKFGGSFVWVASQTIIPQLLRCKDANNNNIFLFNLAAPMQTTLLGVPLMFNDRSPALGSEGDLVLVDCSYYLIKDGSGPFVDASPHMYFTSNQTVIKIFWNVDGKPWLSAPLPLEGATSNTVSPFVVLK